MNSKDFQDIFQSEKNELLCVRNLKKAVVVFCLTSRELRDQFFVTKENKDCSTISSTVDVKK